MKKTLINYLVPWAVLIATGCGLKSSPFDYLSNVSSKEIAATIMRVGAGANPNLSDNQRMSIYGGAHLLEKSGERDYEKNRGGDYSGSSKGRGLERVDELRNEILEEIGDTESKLLAVDRFPCKEPTGIKKINTHPNSMMIYFCDGSSKLLKGE